MEFQIYNIDRFSDTEVLVHGRFCGDSHQPTATLRVVNIISKVYFIASAGHKEHLIAELRAYTNEIIAIEETSRRNIFFKSLDRHLDLLHVSLRRPVSFTDFESDYCELVLTEFSSPVENLVISRGLRGACLAKVELPNVTFDCTGRMVCVPGEAIPAVGADCISYAGPGKLADLRTVALDLEAKNGNVVSFSLYDCSQVLRGWLSSQCHAGDDDLVGIGGCAAATAGHLFKTPCEMLRFLNGHIAKYDVVVYHNFHNKSRLNLKGKIICDIFDFANGNLKGKDFSVAELADLYGIPMSGPGDRAATLMRIFERMNALELAKELSEISGCLLNKCLENSRLERIEYTLLHELYAQGYLFPPMAQKKAVKYAGGLVLEPLQGFYEDVVLLLDFNSLYPSVIQEFDVCFSTIGFADDPIENECTKENSAESASAHLAKRFKSCEDGTVPFLPNILRNLVKRRLEIKILLRKAETEEERALLDIRQRAIKLTANSIYGCLGSPSSRFCNYQMASYITAKGRELLGTAKAVAESLGLRVIYGDTDSIMIHTRFPGQHAFISEAMESALKLVTEINARYRYVEIEIDKAFKKLLLITKKKYAALVFDGPTAYIESKGLDATRRDFCRASTELSSKVLEVILEDAPTAAPAVQKSKADRVYDLCKACVAELQKYPVEMFIIYSSFSKDPSLYNKAVLQPHVNLALRLQREKGIVYRQNDVIPFVIGEGRGQVSERAFHPDERFAIDYRYYVKSQILPPLLRLVLLWPQVSRSRIELIFGVPEVRHSLPETRALTFITECCQTVQAPAPCCAGCCKDVPGIFYIARVSRLLEEQCAALYGTAAVCSACNLRYLNHMQQCFQCGKELVFDPPNQRFDDFLVALESSFRDLGIRQITEMTTLYSTQSAHRIVDFAKYFTQEIELFKQQHPEVGRK